MKPHTEIAFPFTEFHEITPLTPEQAGLAGSSREVQTGGIGLEEHEPAAGIDDARLAVVDALAAGAPLTEVGESIETAEDSLAVRQAGWSALHQDYQLEISKKAGAERLLVAMLEKEHDIPRSPFAYIAKLVDLPPLVPMAQSIVAIADGFQEGRKHGIVSGIKAWFGETKKAFSAWGDRSRKTWRAHTAEVNSERIELHDHVARSTIAVNRQFKAMYPQFNPRLSPAKEAFIKRAEDMDGAKTKALTAKEKLKATSNPVSAAHSSLKWLWHSSRARDQRRDAAAEYDRLHPEESIL